MRISEIANLDPHFPERRKMVQSQLRARGIRDERVLEAMLRIPREEFVSAEFESQAYADHPIPIGENQTISQPVIVAVSLQALSLQGVFFSSRRRHTRFDCDWSSDVCSSD